MCYILLSLVRILSIIIQNYLQNNQILLKNDHCFAKGFVKLKYICTWKTKQNKTKPNQTEWYFKTSKRYFPCPTSVSSF